MGGRITAIEGTCYELQFNADLPVHLHLY